MSNPTTLDDWNGIPEEVEKIIASRIVHTRGAAIRGKSAILTDIKRPFRFIEFSKEIGIDNAQAHRYIRQGVVPEGDARGKIIAWCKKNRRRVK